MSAPRWTDVRAGERAGRERARDDARNGIVRDAAAAAFESVPLHESHDYLAGFKRGYSAQCHALTAPET